MCPKCLWDLYLRRFAPPPKWDILPNTGVTKPGADRIPKVEGERIDERLEAQPEAPSPP